MQSYGRSQDIQEGFVGVVVGRHVVKHQKSAANHKEQTCQVNEERLFYVREDARAWAH